MRVLYTAAEADPFVKTGGLADVAGSLPLELKRQGVDIRVVIPLYVQIEEKYRRKMKLIHEFYVDMDWKHQYCGVFELDHEGVCYYFLDNKEYFSRDQVYGEDDDAERFIYFSKACIMLPKQLDWKPDIIHTNDWHTALVNVYLNDFRRGDSFYDDIKSLFTIHNLKYQGVFPDGMLQMAGLSRFYFNEKDLKFYDSINFMKGGIIHSNAVNTVSGTYALEIQYPFFGENLDGVLRQNNYKLSGILNGIDYDVWNPETDKFIENNYNIDSVDIRKKNKLALQKLYGLPEREDVPMIAMVSRLTDMKGIDLVRYILEELLQEDIQFVVLGTGEYTYEEMFSYFEWRYPEKCAARIYYNNQESHMIYSASDLFLMPSIAEPCGLSQMIAMRYGSVPIVRETGGLKDTVLSYNEDSKEGWGFSFSNINAHDLLFTIRRALAIYKDQDEFRSIQLQGMKRDNTWLKSSERYIDLYQSIIE